MTAVKAGAQSGVRACRVHGACYSNPVWDSNLRRLDASGLGSRMAYEHPANSVQPKVRGTDTAVTGVPESATYVLGIPVTHVPESTHPYFGSLSGSRKEMVQVFSGVPRSVSVLTRNCGLSAAVCI